MLQRIKALFYNKRPSFSGVLPDVPDSRDLIRTPKPMATPEVVDLRAQGRTYALDQGQVGACTGFSSSAFMSNLYGSFDAGKKWEASPMFIYYKAREFFGTVEHDTGAPLRDVMKALHQVGACPMTAHPTLRDWRMPPSAEAVELASFVRIKDYQRIIPEPGAPVVMMRTLHQERLPILIGVQLFASAHSLTVRYDGHIQMPKEGEAGIGGHAMMIDGYDTRTERFYGWNSWGRGWGKGGRFSIPFEYFETPSLCMDIWTVSYKYW